MNPSSSPDTTAAGSNRSAGRDAVDADAAAVAAEAERAEALRILLEMPDMAAPRRPVAQPVPAIDVPFYAAHESSFPVIPSVARAASAPWTLVEAGLALLIVVLAGALFLLTGQELRARAQAARCASELRALAAAFENHHRETGEWPAAASAREALPVGPQKSLADIWSRPTPIGGHYAWTKEPRKHAPALVITAFVPDAPLALSRAEQRRIDLLLDDGDLATGRFQAGFNGWPVYFLASEKN